MNEISEEATRLIDEFEYAVEDAVRDYMMEGGASYKNQARYNLEDYIAELEAENERLKESQRWRIVANGELPVPFDEDGYDNNVLALSIESEEYDVGHCHPEYGWVDYDEGYHSWSREVTHWMPLPTPPEMQE